MTIDFTQYQPPGVYVQDETTPVVTPVGFPLVTVTLVGEARGYQTYAQPVVLSTNGTVLTKHGVLPDSDTSPDLTVRKVDNTVLAEGTDYTLVRGAGAGDATTITRVSTSTAVAEGEQVTVSYAYSDEEYYAPKHFEDYHSIEGTYGPAMVAQAPTDPNGSHVASPLSLAARLAFENGAASVICLAVEPATSEITLQTRFQQAYAKLATESAVTLLVPVFGSGGDASAYNASVMGFISDARVHAEQASGEGLGRLVLFGFDTTYDDTVDGHDYDEVASGLGTKRVVEAYPNRLNFYNANVGQHVEVGGQYLAAAYAGRLSANEIRRGLTQEQVFGFTGIPLPVRQEMTRSYLNRLSGAGVAVTEIGTNNRLVVRHGVTTKTDDLLSREIAVVRTGDALFRHISDGMNNVGLIGDPIDADMLMRVQGELVGLLDTAVGENVILEYLNVGVRQQTLPGGDPTAIECTFTYRPFLPLNYIIVSFSIDVSSGEVTVEEQIAA